MFSHTFVTESASPARSARTRTTHVVASRTIGANTFLLALRTVRFQRTP